MHKYAIDFTDSVNMTEKSHKQECDINFIMRKFQKTGVVDHLKKHQGEYADIPALDYQEAQEIITTANSMFEELPSKARKKFENDPHKFLEYIQDPKNEKHLHDLGLTDPYAEAPIAEKIEQKGAEKEGSKATSKSEGDSEASASGGE